MGMVFVDYKEAFDIVDHGILLQKLYVSLLDVRNCFKLVQILYTYQIENNIAK